VARLERRAAHTGISTSSSASTARVRNLIVDFTFEDPGAFTKPWSATFDLQAGTRWNDDRNDLHDLRRAAVSGAVSAAEACYSHSTLIPAPREDRNEKDACHGVRGGRRLLAVSGPLLAHHATAVFDLGKRLTLTGTVTEWFWANPHCLLRFDVKVKTARWFTGWRKPRRRQT